MSPEGQFSAKGQRVQGLILIYIKILELLYYIKHDYLMGFHPTKEILHAGNRNSV